MAVDEQAQQRVGAPGRLRFVLGADAVDIAVPADVPLADVLTAILAQFRVPPAPAGWWVAQRLGETPLDQERTSTQLGLLDGEWIHLRPGDSPLAVTAPDDPGAEGVEAAGRLPLWSAAHAILARQLGVTAALLAGLVVLLTSAPVTVQIPVSGVSAVLLLVASGVASWSGRSRRTATLLAAVATCYAASSGWLMVMATHPVASGAAQWAAAAAAAAVAVCAGLAGAAHAAPVFAGALTTIVMLLIPITLVALGSASPPHAAAIGLTVTLVVVLFVPGSAFRLGGLSLPLLPTNADELREDIEPLPHRTVVERGANTLRYLKGLHTGLGIAQCVLLAFLLTEDGAFAFWFTIAVTLLLFLRARHLSGAVQRWAVLVPGAFAAVSVVVRRVSGEDSPSGVLLHAWFPVFTAGVVLLLLSTRLPGRRLKPYWLRGVDILESLTAVAVFPLLLGVLDVYNTMRELGS
ncbi:type VII secretion integral membrane protein EccD [Actinophytocola oryzae]|uniref:Type VII secretion integral membrane protein EccD n=1 Tax=Actinophytocola oryzae TaxID=502181 RepID=A0A4R7UTY5_9PSEU|nr:type VII secretion integral membrane protein EccD [Actinophytocola oryzae]TDV38612.1 type VII secretion integral membrane protein EccD [Actinophytocola oryzae]